MFVLSKRGGRLVTAAFVLCVVLLAGLSVAADDLTLTPTPMHGVTAWFDEDGMTLVGRSGWEQTLSLKSVGRDEAGRPVEAVVPYQALRFSHRLGLAGQPRVLSVVAYDRPTFEEWYAADSEGLAQGFVLAERPSGDGVVMLTASVTGDLLGREEAAGTQVSFALDGRDVLRVQGVMAVDDSGRALPAWLEYDEFGGVGELRVVIDDADAVYPVFVDPLYGGVLEEHAVTVEGAWVEPPLTKVEFDAAGGLVLAGGQGDGMAAHFDAAGAPTWSVKLPGATLTALGELGDGFVVAGERAGIGAVWGISASGEISWKTELPQLRGVEGVATGENGLVVGGPADGIAAGETRIVRLSELGDVVWQAAASGENVTALAIDSIGEVIAAVGGANASLIKWRDLGVEAEVAWTLPLGLVEPAALALDDADAIVVVGATVGDEVDFATLVVSANGKLLGEAVYAGPVGEDRALAVAVNAADTIFVTGSSQGPGSDDDYLTVKYERDGSGLRQVWVARYDGPAASMDRPQALVLDGRGNVLVTGVSFGAGTGADFATVQYADLGAMVEESWVARYQGPGGGADGATALAAEGLRVAAAGFTAHGDSEDGYTMTAAVYKACEDCEIGGVCYADGEVAPGNTCLVCDVAQSPIEWTVLGDGEACDNGLFCDGDDTCTTGQCTTHVGSPCAENGLWCSGSATCDETNDLCGFEFGPSNPRCPDDAIWCNGEESCDEGGDQCASEYPSGNRCNDDVYCNGLETCDDGADECVAGTEVSCPDDGEWCNGLEACDEDAGLCGHEFDESNARCDDGDFCNGVETCNDDTDQCVDNIDPCGDDFMWCNGLETCDETEDACGHEFSEEDPRCPSDGLVCNGEESCNEAGDACAQSAPPECLDDFIYCNGTEYCDNDEGGCAHTGDPCGDDGLYCNGAEYCDEDAGLCDSVGDPCADDGLWCNGIESCVEDDDACISEYTPENPRCTDDGVWCNGDEFCNEDVDDCVSDYPSGVGRCADDGNWCNGDEFCVEDDEECASEFGSSDPRCTDDGEWCNGSELCAEDIDECVSEYDLIINVRCPEDELYCNGEEFCDEPNDTCGAHNIPECPDDGAWCNGAELCNEATDDCTHEYLFAVNPRCPENTDYCDGSEFCDEGADECSHHTIPCGDDGFFCNGEEGCEESTDQCTHEGNPCSDDGQFCNGDESCEEALRECVHAGDPCQEWEICSEQFDQCLEECNGCLIGGVCYGNGQFNPINDCLICNEGANPDDWSFNDGFACDDGVFCNGEDSCLSGSCSDHAGDECPDDGEWCTGVESCDEENDQCLSEYGPSNLRCPDDSLWCTGVESCDEDGDACVSEYDDTTDPRCPDDAQYCDGDEFCDEGGDACAATGNPCAAGLICDEGEDECIAECVGCLILDVCYTDGQANPDNECEVCNVSLNPTGWLPNADAVCNDGIYCNGGDFCNSSGQCAQHVGNPCPDDGEWCNGEELCDEGADQCEALNVPDCTEDGLWCNGEDFCNEDTNACDVRDVPNCGDDGTWCNGAEFCNEDEDICDTSGDPCPDDGQFCSGLEQCNEDLDSCYQTGDPCADDGQFCNGDEFCDEGVDTCGHEGDPCEENELCNEPDDSCDPLADDDDDVTPGDDDDTTPGDDDDDDDDDDDNDDSYAPPMDDDDEPTGRTEPDEEEGGGCGC
jgi:hypothetical protein